MISLLPLPALFAGSPSATTTVSNVHGRKDVTGSYFDAHDGSTQQFERGGFYYYHAMGYGRCRENGKSADGCGTGNNNTVGVWRSKTLASGSWELLSSFTPSKSGWPVCTYFRSHALRSEATGKYVLWLNAQHCDAVCPSGSKGKCFVAGVSDLPEGPFTFSGVVKNVRYVGEGGVGDFALFQDDDSSRTAYIIYKRSGGAPGVMAHRMTLQRLEPSLLSASPAQDASAGIIGAPFVEAPAMFKRQGIYYALFGQCCAFCSHGSGIGVYTSAKPLGPWIEQGNIGCASEVPLGCGCGMRMPTAYNVSCPLNATATTYAQQNSVIVTGGGDIVWTGDRWQSACASTVASQGLPPTELPADLDCIKAYDLQYWSVLRFVGVGVDIPIPAHIVFEPEISLRP